MINEEEKIVNLFKSAIFILFMMSISVLFGHEATIILLLSLLFLKRG